LRKTKQCSGGVCCFLAASGVWLRGESMKNEEKTVLKIGLTVSAVSLLLAAASLISFALTPADQYSGRGNFLWLLYLILAVISELCLLYASNRVFENRRRNRHKKLNTALAAVLILSIPVLLISRGSIIWLPWHILLFVLEVISFRKDRQLQQEETENSD